MSKNRVRELFGNLETRLRGLARRGILIGSVFMAAAGTPPAIDTLNLIQMKWTASEPYPLSAQWRLMQNPRETIAWKRKIKR